MIRAEQVEKLIRPDLKAIRAYTPIEPTDVLSERIEIPAAHVIKLDGNENPYGCSPKVKDALANHEYHLYPDPEQRKLCKALEKYARIGSKHIIVGSGSDELIDLILRLFIKPGDEVINCPPTFGMYTFSTSVCGGKVVNIPRRHDYSVDVKAVKKTIGKRTKAIFIASPNNPSGNVTSKAQILELLNSDAVIVADEAYHEFSGITVASLVPKYPNLVVLRTFSKWAGLAGLRIGYGLFPTNLVEHLMKIKQPYNVSVAAQVAALESLRDLPYLQSTIKAITNERERLRTKLAEIDWLKTYPSQANFILCTVLKGDAKAIHQKLQRKGIFVRHFDTPELKDCLRISVGKPEHTNVLIATLKDSH